MPSLGLLTGCVLRWNDFAMLDIEAIRLREGRWVLADLERREGKARSERSRSRLGQAGHQCLMTAAGIEEGRLVRRVFKSGKVQGKSLSDWAVWPVVERTAREIGTERFGAHDLRRTCAKLCRKAGGHLEPIKFLLGHSSIQMQENRP